LSNLKADATPPSGSNECIPGFVGQLPYRGNCNRFIHCNNGNRSKLEQFVMKQRHVKHVYFQAFSNVRIYIILMFTKDDAFSSYKQLAIVMSNYLAPINSNHTKHFTQ